MVPVRFQTLFCAVQDLQRPSPLDIFPYRALPFATGIIAIPFIEHWYQLPDAHTSARNKLSNAGENPTYLYMHNLVLYGYCTKTYPMYVAMYVP